MKADKSVHIADSPTYARSSQPILPSSVLKLELRLTMGTTEDYEAVLKGKYPAKQHAKKVADYIISKGGEKTGTIYLEAQKSKLLEVCLNTSIVVMI